jgi:hypothetical protein
VGDIGRAVVFLVSEDAKNITGQILSISGGGQVELEIARSFYVLWNSGTVKERGGGKNV